MRRLVFLAAVVVAGGLLFLGTTRPFWLAVAEVTGDTPEARIRAFAASVARGALRAAESIWQLPSPLPDSPPTARVHGAPLQTEAPWAEVPRRLEARRAAVIGALIDARVDANVEFISLQWWRTCCEPGVIPSAHGAGALRARIRFVAGDGRTLEYTADVLARDKMPLYDGLPARGWTLRDLYLPWEEPLSAWY